MAFSRPPVSSSARAGHQPQQSRNLQVMALKRAKEQLESFADSKLLGVVINNLQTAEMGSHYFESHYHQ